MSFRRYLTSLSVLVGVTTNLGAMWHGHPRSSRNIHSDPSRNDRSGYKKDDVSGSPGLWVQYLTVYGCSCFSLSPEWRAGPPPGVPGDESIGCPASSFTARNDFDLPPSLDWLVRRKLIIVRLTEVQCSPSFLQTRREEMTFWDPTPFVRSCFSCQYGPEMHIHQSSLW